MNMVLDKLIEQKTAKLIDEIKIIPTKKVVSILNRDFKKYDFKKETFDLMKNLVTHQLQSRCFKIITLIDSEIPSLPTSIHVDAHQYFNNSLYMTLLNKQTTKQKNKKYTYTTVTDKKYDSEKKHAFNTYRMLKILKADKVKYEDDSFTKCSRNMLVKATLSHQNYCFVTGEELSNSNTSIDHLIPQDSKHQSELIKAKQINNICNLAKMSKQANNQKRNMSLLEYHNEVGGFKFYPINVLYILHMQKELVKHEFNRSDDIRIANELIKNYVDKYKKTMGSMEKLLESIEVLPTNMFENISKKQLISLISRIS